MTGQWNQQCGCPVGILKKGKVYSMVFSGQGRPSPQSPHGHGSSAYTFEVFDTATNKRIEFQHIPSNRVLRNLAKKYLASSYYPFLKERNLKLHQSFLFYIEAGVSKDKLAAFLATAVVKGLK